MESRQEPADTQTKSTSAAGAVAKHPNCTSSTQPDAFDRWTDSYLGVSSAL